MLKQTQLCTHLSVLTDVRSAQEYVCEECIKAGDSWVHLRTCQTCGTTLCCDSSPNKHATRHYHTSQHPVVASAEPGERWLWCYADEQMAGY
ncbi:putative UBP type Zn finger protein [Spirosoma lacussanchae]|uniref:UBP-type zinc finger domain-containing protein n=1 Tax=Spirosoma lacussanchae TaxID=1884249 RepID=UPI001107C697|nr:UBP-type zinc finger domain-containing protein [Spirosoma lacussanchae]